MKQEKISKMTIEKLQQIKYRFLGMSKRNIIKIITICFSIYMVFLLIESFFEMYGSNVIIECSLFEIIFMTIATLITFIFEKKSIILIYLGFIFGIKRFKKDKLSSIDFKKYKVYYREILRDYSPAELSYIDNFEILPKNDIVATLLSLELKKIISLNDSDGKIQIEHNNIGEISSNEKYILDSIEDGKINNFNETEFITRVKEDAVKNGLLKESHIYLLNVLKYIMLYIVTIYICAFLFIGSAIFPNADIFLGFIILFILVSMFCLPTFSAIYLITYIIRSIMNRDVRTSKGEVINEKLEGLKNYLKDYSLIHEKNEESLNLWEDYLIYSVIFNQNTTIIKSICDKYINIF